ALRHANPVLRRRSFFQGATDVTWLRPEGREMDAAAWQDGSRHCLGMLVHGAASEERDDRGRPIGGASLLLLLNGGDTACSFALPAVDGRAAWREEVHTAHPGRRLRPRGTCELP